MDVHLPEHPIHTWRDFFIHLITITIGLLIALGLEGMVGWAHHRSLVHEARETLHVEIGNNLKEATDDLAFVKQDEARMQANLETERQLRDHPKNFHGKIQATLSWSSPADSAWQTAHEAGALTYMPYAEVQRYTEIYQQQGIVNNAAIQVFTSQTSAVAPVFIETSPDKLSPEGLRALQMGTAETYTGLTTLEQMLSELRRQYAEILGKQ